MHQISVSLHAAGDKAKENLNWQVMDVLESNNTIGIKKIKSFNSADSGR